MNKLEGLRVKALNVKQKYLRFDHSIFDYREDYYTIDKEIVNTLEWIIENTNITKDSMLYRVRVPMWSKIYYVGIAKGWKPEEMTIIGFYPFNKHTISLLKPTFGYEKLTICATESNRNEFTKWILNRENCKKEAVLEWALKK